VSSDDGEYDDVEVTAQEYGAAPEYLSTSILSKKAWAVSEGRRAHSLDLALVLLPDGSPEAVIEAAGAFEKFLAGRGPGEVTPIKGAKGT
jgi:hypothetical protein